MRKHAMLVSIVLMLVIMSNSVTLGQDEQRGHKGFVRRHPWLSTAGVGALTGGVGGVLLGGTLLHGAAMGAGTHTGFHYLHEKYAARKRRHQTHG